jgi:hypothetical protein
VASTALFSAIAVATLKPDSIKGLTGLFILFYLYCGACGRLGKRCGRHAAVWRAASACREGWTPRDTGVVLTLPPRCILLPSRERQARHHVPALVCTRTPPLSALQPASCCCPTRCRLPCTPSTGPTPSASACAPSW